MFRPAAPIRETILYIVHRIVAVSGENRWLEKVMMPVAGAHAELLVELEGRGPKQQR